jgi:CelD/BcsL family acetyltransferase involved in cellulose biosynthesis
VQILLIGITLGGSLASALLLQKALLHAWLFAIDPNRRNK